MWQLPPAASTHAPAIDGMLSHIHLVILVLFAGWAAYFLYLLIRYRAGNHPRATHAGTRGRLAIVFTAGLVLTEGVLLVTAGLPLWFERTARRPAGPAPIAVRAIAEQFAWSFHYPGADGQYGTTSVAMISPENPLGLDRSSPFAADDVVSLGEMVVPIDEPVLVELSSKDVIHSFGIPAMRVKQDATPGLRTPVWFTPTALGEFEIACSQLCGLGHYRMRAIVRVTSREEFGEFLKR
jgi:cytochrome c oxidase subunit 2